MRTKARLCLCLPSQNMCLLLQAIDCLYRDTNGWTEGAKACQLAVSLRGEAAEILQTLPDTERLNLNSLYNAVDLRFGQKYSKDYARLQMKIRLQKTAGECLQEYASEVARLANLAFSDHPETVRETISLQYFVDGLREGEIQKAVRMTDVQDLKSALLYALKLTAAKEASCRDRHSIRRARVTADTPCESPWIKEIEKLREEIQALMAQYQLADPEIKQIIEFKESSDKKPSWQDIVSSHPTTKRYWALWDSLHLRNGVLYRKWEYDDGKTFRWQLILPKTRISTVLKELHGSPTGDHFGVVKTLQKVHKRFYCNNERSKSVVAHVTPVLHAKVLENALEEDCNCIMWERPSNE
ncbi:uncharacterized protein TNCV_4457941 [Trichonephila clavipes]|nr:uncharacterized protein TNCV_4457941 [Trichonephila clavipes]